jgi:hypothetical protein
LKRGKVRQAACEKRGQIESGKSRKKYLEKYFAGRIRSVNFDVPKRKR